MAGTGEHRFGANSPVGGNVLASRRESSIGGSDWPECLCLERIGEGRWRLVVASEGLDLVDESIPFDQERDEDGELPDEPTHCGRPVRRGEDWWEYADGRVGLVQHDDGRGWILGPGDLEEARRVLVEDGWNHHPSWRAILRRLRMALAGP